MCSSCFSRLWVCHVSKRGCRRQSLRDPFPRNQQQNGESPREESLTVEPRASLYFTHISTEVASKGICLSLAGCGYASSGINFLYDREGFYLSIIFAFNTHAELACRSDPTKELAVTDIPQVRRQRRSNMHQKRKALWFDSQILFPMPPRVTSNKPK